MEKRNIKHEFELLYPNMSAETVEKEYRKLNRITVLIGIGGVAVILLLYGGTNYLQSKGGTIRELVRNEYGGGSEAYQLTVYGLTEDPVDIELELNQQTLSEEEAADILKQAEESLRSSLENTYSLDWLDCSLDLPEKIGMVEVSWQSSDETLLAADGSLVADPGAVLKEGISCDLTAFMSLGAYEQTCIFPITISGDLADETQRRIYQYTASLNEMAAESEGDAVFSLPEEYETYQLSYRRENEWENLLSVGIILIVIGAVLLIVKLRNRPETMLARREEELKRDYPKLVMQMSSLLMAGYPVRQAWEEICVRYRTEQRKKKCYVYEEMLLADSMLQLGKPQLPVYRNFANRIGLYDYQRFVEILDNFICHGHYGKELLEEEILRTGQMRYQYALQEAKKTETGMLIPMFGMFIMVLVILFVPAFMGMGM